MVIYNDKVLPHIIDKACGMKAMRPHRERVCAGLEGEVIEIGLHAQLQLLAFLFLCELPLVLLSHLVGR